MILALGQLERALEVGFALRRIAAHSLWHRRLEAAQEHQRARVFVAWIASDHPSCDHAQLRHVGEILGVRAVIDRARPRHHQPEQWRDVVVVELAIEVRRQLFGRQSKRLPDLWIPLFYSAQRQVTRTRVHQERALLVVLRLIHVALLLRDLKGVHDPAVRIRHVRLGDHESKSLIFRADQVHAFELDDAGWRRGASALPVEVAACNDVALSQHRGGGINRHATHAAARGCEQHTGERHASEQLG
jgi:hypothetical protein